MVNYTCPKCNKEFNRKSNFNYHISDKKKPCKAKEVTIPPNPPDLPQNPQKSPNNKIADIIEMVHCCEFCDRIFTRKDHLKRHLEGRCKVKKSNNNELTEVIEENKQLKIELQNQNKQIEELKILFYEFSKQKNKRTGKNTTNNNNTTNIQTQNNTQNNNTQTNNINIILPYGKELEKIKLSEVLDHMIVRDFDNMIPNLVKYIYLNKDKPESQNFVVNDIARNKCQYYNGEKWITRKANNQLLKLFENTNSLITDPFDRPELEKTLKFINENKKYQTKINTILESKTFAKSLFDESDKENLDKRQEILDELKLIFYSHKDEILKICV